jgi:hypothetical protein
MRWAKPLGMGLINIDEQLHSFVLLDIPAGHPHERMGTG